MSFSFELTLSDGSVLNIPARESARCVRLILRVKGDGFELVYPHGAPRHGMEEFLRSSLHWIESVQKRRTAYRKVHPAAPKVRPDSLFLAFTGEEYRIRYTPLEVSWTAVKTESPGSILVSGKVDDFESCAAVLRKWLIRKSESALLAHAKYIAENHGFADRIGGFRTGLQKRTWGTCTREGVVTLNAALLFFTKPAAEYVILHEFCHLSEMNHSPRFWAKLEALYPGAKAMRETFRKGMSALPAWLG